MLHSRNLIFNNDNLYIGYLPNIHRLKSILNLMLQRLAILKPHYKSLIQIRNFGYSK